jgi:hypothetical protein|tara:strand:- start:104 stop:241 length:138 start_codon:yes stop_codon:yes gene_type:complete
VGRQFGKLSVVLLGPFFDAEQLAPEHYTVTWSEGRAKKNGAKRSA